MTWCCWPRSGRPGRRGAARCRPAASRSRPIWTPASGAPGCWWSRPSRPAATPACALALLGQTSRWKAGARATLRALATIIAALPDPAAGPARATASKSTTARHHHCQQHDRCQHHHGQPQRDQHGRARPAGDTLATALVAGAPSAIVAVDADRRIREFNPSAEALFGRSRADTLGLDMPETLVPEQLPAAVRGRHGRLPGHRGPQRVQPPRPAARPAGRRHRAAGRAHARCRSRSAGETYFFGFLRDATELENATMAVAEGDARFAAAVRDRPGRHRADRRRRHLPVRERQVVRRWPGIPACRGHRPQLAQHHPPG